MCPASTRTNRPMRSKSRLEFYEKMHESDGSISFFTDEDEDGNDDMPSLKAISMSSLHFSMNTEDSSEDLRVRFSAIIDCRSCLHINDYSAKEAKACFYSTKERAKMSESREDIINKIARGVNEEDEDEILRGLEYWCEESCVDIDRRVDAVIQLIMDEQDSQIDNCIFDEYTLSVSAQSVTAESAKCAREIAEEDARLAKEAYLEMAHKESIATYVMPATLGTIEGTKEQRLSKRRLPKKKRESKVEVEASTFDELVDFLTPSEVEALTPSEEFTVPKKVKKAPTSSEELTPVTKKKKKIKKKPRSSSVPSKKQNETTEKSTTNKTSKRSSSKSPKNNKKKLKPKKEKRSSSSRSIGTDKDTVATEPTDIESFLKQLTEHSLSSDEEDDFLKTTKKQSKKNKPPSHIRRHTVSGPIPDFEEDEDESPGMQKRFSWWDLSVAS